MATKQTHICKYCGAETSQDDEECHAKPNKQTAVEWLEEQLVINGSGAIQTFPELFEQAKQMHKEQIIKANFDGFVDGVNVTPDTEIATCEQYYNETYGNN